MAYTSLARPSGSPTHGTESRSRAAPDNNTLLITIYVILLFVPINIFIGPARLTPYRIFILILLVPALLKWLSGQLDGIKKPDIIFFFFASWTSLTLLIHHGIPNMIQGSIILFVESFGSYIVARMLIRNEREFISFVSTLAVCLFILLLFVMHEAITGYRFLTFLFQGSGARFGISQMEYRYGMLRAQGMFEHPILLGVFASMAMPLSFYALRAKFGFFRGMLGTIGPGMTTFFSLSMGAWLASFFHVALIGYDFVTRKLPHRWNILLYLSMAAYVFLSIASNRGPVGILLDKLAHNPVAAWSRVAQWNFGSAAVLRSPIIGIGNRPFPRPAWVTASVDNFWLVWGLRGGLPSAIAIILGVVLVCVAVSKAQYKDSRYNEYRKGAIISIVGVCFAISSVHVWNATFSLLLFLLGASVWLSKSSADVFSAVAAPSGIQEAPVTSVHSRPRSPYGRDAR